MLTSFDRATCQMIRAELDAAFAAITAKHGVSISAGRMSFSHNYISVKLDIAPAVMTSGGTVSTETPHERNFRTFATGYGLQVNDLGRILTLNGRRYKIAGLNPSKPKNAIMIERVPDGKGFVTSAAQVRRSLPVLPAAPAAPKVGESVRVMIGEAAA